MPPFPTCSQLVHVPSEVAAVAFDAVLADLSLHDRSNAVSTGKTDGSPNRSADPSSRRLRTHALVDDRIRLPRHVAVTSSP